MKKCPKCNKFKSLDLFPKTKQSKIACKSCKSEYDKKHYQKNRKKRLKQSHKYNETRIKNEAWYEREREYMKKRRIQNPHIFRWRDIFNRTLKQIKNNKKSYTTIKHMGYSSEEFKTHIESQFKEGQNWDNISIDHKIPLTWFKKNTPLYLVNNLKNLQILTLKENISKNNYYSSKISFDYYNKIIIFIKEEYKNKIKI
jgi:hypothetical protein